MVRVLLVGKGPPERGGIPTFLTSLQSGLRAAGDDVELCNLTRSEVAPQGGAASAANLGRTLRDVRVVWQASADADVVHVHSAGAPLVTFVRAIALVLAGRLRGAATVLHVHGGLVERWLVHGWQRWLVRVLLRLPHRTITVSETTRAALLSAGAAPQRVATLPNGIDTGRFAGQPHHQQPPTILYVGLLTPRKGLLDLFAASRLLHERGIDHRLRLVGGTPDEGADAEAEVRAAAPGWAELTGPLPYERVPEAYLHADVFCLPSWWEAMPLTVLEAMAAGLPVVATAVGDVASLVDDGVHGAIVPPRDPTALAAALERLLRDPVARREQGEAGRARARSRYDVARVTDEVRREYALAARR